MKSGKVHIYIGSLLALLISVSLTVSTLHSHGHIEWHHPDGHAETGHCLIIDTALCPICGYLSNADFSSSVTVKGICAGSKIIKNSDTQRVTSSFTSLVTGRSPPIPD